MNILFSPAHYIFDEDDRGSELSWAYKIVDTIASQTTSTVITGYKNTKQKKYPLIEVQPQKKTIDLGIINSLRFNFLYTKETFKQLHIHNFDIIHHVLPFGIGNTFNFALIFRYKKLPIVIGPIQNPLPYFGDNVEDIKNTTYTKKLIDLNKLFITLFQPILNTLSLLTLKKADRIIVVNNKTKQLLIEKGISKNNIVIIPPGISTEQFTYTRKGISTKRPVEILIVAALVYRKGIDVALKGLSLVAKQNTNFRVTIVGVGPQLEYLKQLTKELHLTSYITFAGYVPYKQMPEIYKKADIFISMTKAESFATVCLEAMASGLAIISSNTGGFIDAITPEKEGFLVNSADYESMAEKTLYLLNNPKIITIIGNAAQNKINNQYDWNRHIVPKYMAIYNNLLY